MYKGNMGDFVDKVDRYLKDKGWAGVLRLDNWAEGQVLICRQDAYGDAKFVHDREDFEEVVYEFVKKYVKI